MNQITPGSRAIQTSRIITAAEADRHGSVLDNCLRQLPNAGLTGLHDHNYWKLIELTRELHRLREKQQAVADAYLDNLLHDWDGRTIHRAFKTQFDTEVAS